MIVDLSSHVVLVAGGTGGLGKSISLAFLSEGARVVVTYRNEQEFVFLRDLAGANQSALEGHSVDVTNEAATRALVNTIITRHGKLDALVNAVGGYAGGVTLWDMETKVFDQMLALNLRSGYALVRAVLPSMLKSGRGAIVNIAAKAALDHGAGAGAYAASKAAALALMDSLAGDTKGTGVRVNSVLPSIIDTRANRLAMPDSDFAAWPKPEDIAKVVLFLCSDASRVIHGAAVPVFGNS